MVSWFKKIKGEQQVENLKWQFDQNSEKTHTNYIMAENKRLPFYNIKLLILWVILTGDREKLNPYVEYLIFIYFLDQKSY